MDLPTTTALFAVLADPTRVRLLALLQAHEMSAAELVDVLGVAQSRMSAHLSRLKQAGLLSERRAGNAVFLRMDAARLDTDVAALWATVRTGVEDRALEKDSARAEDAIRARTRVRDWPDAAAGQMEKHYSPGRTWESLAHGLASLPDLGDVVDLGGGDGTVCALLAARCRSITLVDSNARMVEAARHRLRGQDHVTCVEADAESLPLEDGRFDHALAWNVLADTRHPDRVVAEAARVLRPGGVLSVITLKAHEHEEHTAAYGQLHAGFRGKQLATWVTRAGLAVESCELTSREKRAPHLEVLTLRARKQRTGRKS